LEVSFLTIIEVIKMVSQTKTSLVRKFVLVMFALFISVFAVINESKAQAAGAAPAQDRITQILCNVSGAISGPIGKAIAVLIVISLAIALFLGKVSWGMAIAVAVGMGVLFGAQGIVQLASGDTAQICAAAPAAPAANP
jgi:type IV secretion system protein VirB2